MASVKGNGTRMKSGIVAPRGPHGTWSHNIYLGLQPAMRCLSRSCPDYVPREDGTMKQSFRVWIGAERPRHCPKCGAELAETNEPRQIRTGGFMSKRDAELDHAKAVVRLGHGSYTPPARMTLATYLRDKWLPVINDSRKLKQTTKECYARHVRYHLIGPAAQPHALGLVELRKLTPQMIRDHYEELSHGYKADRKGQLVARRGLAVESLRRVHACLHRALADAVEEGYLDHNPAWRAARNLTEPDAQVKEPPAWTPEERRIFLDSQRGQPHAALWHLVAFTGLRRGEAAGLKWGDCDLDRARITVRRNRVPVSGGVVVETSTKTNRVRVVDLDAETVRVLRAHHDAQRSATVVLLQDSNNYVFVDDHGEPLNPNSISYRFRRAVKQSGLRHVPLHGLRHSHVTELLGGRRFDT